MEGSQKPDPRRVGEMGTKNNNVEGDCAWQRAVRRILSAEAGEGQATCRCKSGSRRSTKLPGLCHHRWLGSRAAIKVLALVSSRVEREVDITVVSTNHEVLAIPVSCWVVGMELAMQFASLFFRKMMRSFSCNPSELDDARVLESCLVNVKHGFRGGLTTF